MKLLPFIGRRGFLLASAALLAACAQTPRTQQTPQTPQTQQTPPAAGRAPIVFVHGNGDTAALWHTTVWRFESNGWPRDRLFAIDHPYPQSRDADDVAQPGRSSAAEHRAFLAAEVERVLRATGARQVVLIGNSRGGNAIRNYIANGGAAKVSHAILGGTPNHGVWSDAGFRPTNEFNGAGPFLTALNNQGGSGVEITPGVKWMTVRSADNDKFAQADGVWIGAKGRPTNVTAASPELEGALNVVLPGIDHRETSYGPLAFSAAWRFLTGSEPAHTQPLPETRVMLDGVVSGFGLANDPARGTAPTNLPLVGATVEVYATDAHSGERVGAVRWRKTVGADGRWGPFQADGRTPYEFVVSAPGYALAHIYRSPFPRSSNLVGLRAERPLPEADKAAGSVLRFARPRGYFGVPRDRLSFDGIRPAPGIAPGVAGVADSRLRLPPAAPRAVVAEFNGERIVGRSWPASENRSVVLELHD